MVFSPQSDINGCWHPGGGTSVYGILGYPVTHSLSPWMHRLFAAQQDLDLAYVPFPVHEEVIATALAGLPTLGVRGVNVTVPHKEAMLPLMQQLSAAARAIGAVNTVCFTPSGIEGHNTDALGFQRALERAAGNGWQQYPATVIGAGGAARAIVYALGHAGCPAIYLANRHLPRAESLAAQFPDLPVHPLPLDSAALSAVLPHSALLVNTSARGLHGEGHPELNLARMPRNGSVYDIVYNPLETPLLHAARQAGLGAIDGLGMLVEQGAESFRIWTGTLPQTAAVEEVLRRWLRIQNTSR